MNTKISIDAGKTDLSEIKRMNSGKITAVKRRTLYVLHPSGKKVVEIHLVESNKSLKAGVEISLSALKKDPHITFDDDLGGQPRQADSSNRGRGCKSFTPDKALL